MKSQERQSRLQGKGVVPEAAAASRTAKLPAAAQRFRSLFNGLALCLVGGLYALALAHSANVPFVYDEAVYMQIGEKTISTGCPISAQGAGEPFLYNPPLVTYVTAFARMLGGDGLMWLRAANDTVWLLPAAVAVWRLAAEMFGPAAGALALMALYSPQRFILEASEVKLDVPLAGLGALFLWCLYRLRTTTAERGCVRYCIACAVLAGLGCLTKSQGVLLPASGVLYVFLTSLQQRTPAQAARERRAAWVLAAWILGGALAAGVLWLTLGTLCGGDFVTALRWSLQRATFQSDEPWFHRPLLVYWTALAQCIGPVLLGGFIATILLWGRRLSDPRLLLLAVWLLLTFAFCSGIGLRNERYFLSAVPALAVLTGALASTETYEGFSFLRSRPPLVQALRLTAGALVLATTLFLLWQTTDQLSRLTQVGTRSNAYYLTLGKLIQQTIPPDERVLLSRVQTAYLAKRNYYLSEYDIDPAAVLGMLANPQNRITLVAMDSPQMLRDDMPPADQQKVWEYVRSHFAPVPGAPRGAAVYRRTSW